MPDSPRKGNWMRTTGEAALAAVKSSAGRRLLREVAAGAVIHSGLGGHHWVRVPGHRARKVNQMLVYYLEIAGEIERVWRAPT